MVRLQFVCNIYLATQNYQIDKKHNNGNTSVTAPSSFTIQPLNNRKRRYFIEYENFILIFYLKYKPTFFSKYDEKSSPHKIPNLKNKHEEISSNQSQFNGFHTAKTELVR